jgi:hypothetical protein
MKTFEICFKVNNVKLLSRIELPATSGNSIVIRKLPASSGDQTILLAMHASSGTLSLTLICKDVECKKILSEILFKY